VRVLDYSNNQFYPLGNWNCVVIVYNVGSTKLKTLLPRILHTMPDVIGRISYAATQTNKSIHYKTVERTRHILNSTLYEDVSSNGLLGAVKRSDKKWGFCVSFIASYWGRDISCLGGLYAYLQVENLWGKRSQGDGSKAW